MFSQIRSAIPRLQSAPQSASTSALTDVTVTRASPTFSSSNSDSVAGFGIDAVLIIAAVFALAVIAVVVAVKVAVRRAQKAVVPKSVTLVSAPKDDATTQ